MSYEEFLRQIEWRVKNRMGREVRVCIYPVSKNNSILLDCLTILEQGDNISPAIYLNGFYRDYLSGESMEQIISRILNGYYYGKEIKNMDTSFYRDVRKVKSRVVCRLINYEKNKAFLEQVPHRPFLNLAIVYCYLLEHEKIGTASILIRNEHMKLWGLEEAEIYMEAVKNMKRLLPWEFLSMEAMLQSMFHSDPFQYTETEVPLYVLSNREKNYGAVWMTDREVLENIGEMLGKNYYVLPSSVHECMVIPENAMVEVKILQDMVREMNETQVEPEEVLADTVYHYDRQQKKLSTVLLEKQAES